MKATKIILSLAMIGTFTLGFAATDVTIDAQIQEIQSAPASERVELMNELKTQLSNMNAEDRSAAITQMQEHGESGEMNHEQMQGRGAQMQEHASEMQMEHGNEMNRMQNMNQQQAGSQLGHKNSRSGGSSNMQNISSGKGKYGEGRH